MLFEKFSPPPELAFWIREVWVIESEDTTPFPQKIIPDGYDEIILHYGDPYRIRINSDWEMQEQFLLAGQIKRFFFLENTGRSAMLGIKLHADGMHALFGTDMAQVTDHVIPLAGVTDPPLYIVSDGLPIEERVNRAFAWIEQISRGVPETTRLSAVLDEILSSQGLADIEGLAQRHAFTRRNMERTFNRIVGLTPKFYSRIVQFNAIFKALQYHDASWIDIALNAGYYDQSHFIRNFKAFTGEVPAQYGFTEENMANFFLRK